ncbi:MAG: PSD1 and planctomycete cytochrome C domain-containing protein [Gemmataceae bacterium]
MACAFGIVTIVGLPVLHADDHFENQIRPLLTQHCLSCHGSLKSKAGLRLDSKSGWQTGGESGPAIVPGKPEQSLIIKAVRGAKDVPVMPPKGKLSEREIAALEKWIRDGAPDPRDGMEQIGAMSRDDAKRWWSFQPVTRPTVPKLPNQVHKNPIDKFIAASLASKKLSLSAPADKRTLIRRATYDLTGLPPTNAEIDEFLKDDSPQAFAKVVDRLLASPHYGEKWGRHWLDLVRYADTAGENSDHPLPHAWRYRNWVIDAFNRDRPYDQFLKEQIAGDLLEPNESKEPYSSRIVATGFLALARRFDHDSDKSMHLTHEDGIDTIGKAFLGLTLGCARCHDHKYDAVSSRDYYALYGILDSSKFSFPGCEAKQQPRDLVPLMPPSEWERVVKPFQDKLNRLEAEIRKGNDERNAIARGLQSQFEKSRRVLSKGEVPDGGDKRFDGGEQPISMKAGELLMLSITPLKNYGADTTLVEWEIQEVDGAKRTWNLTNDLVDNLLAGNPHADRNGFENVWWLIDPRNQPTLLLDSVRDSSGKPGLHVWRNGDNPSVFVNSTQTDIAAWTKLPARSLFVHPSPNGNVALSWLSPVSGQFRIRGRVKDAHPGGPDGVGWVLEHFAASVKPDLAKLASLSASRIALDRQKAELLRTAPKQDVAFAVVEGKPADARVHLRGDPEKLGDVVPRRWLEVLGGTPIASGQQSGRRDLANWIASKSNPLTARVMVNRLWQFHFGKGLVKTPNDFGTRGLRPSHPELLDWLAAEFVEKGWSIKAMHRTMMLSETYCQSSVTNPDALAIDPTNDLNWWFDRRRLTAEELRDSLLAVSGQLDRQPGEAHPFPPESGWSFSQHVPFSTFFESNKRSVYLVSIRNRRHPFLGLFDGADPNATTPTRQATTVPTQALFFLNDPFFHAQAGKLAERVLIRPESARADDLFRQVFTRSATEKERAWAGAFVEQYRRQLTTPNEAERTNASWSALARILLASNEFLYVE